MSLTAALQFLVAGIGISGIFILIVHKFMAGLGVKNGRLILASLSFILQLFFAGFGLRVSEEKNLIDLGFMLTDAAFLLTYLLFTTALLLGQVKYYGTNK